MELIVLGSSSAGNCYILKGETETLIIECGISFNKVKQALNFDFRNVVGALLTHEHGDHAKHVPNFLKFGIDVYCSYGTASVLNIDYSPHLKPMRPLQQYNIGSFVVLAFAVQHDCAEPVGFLIYHKECGRILFLTDSYYTQYKFPGVNHFIVEANYSREIVLMKLAAGQLHQYLGKRLLTAHMEIETTVKMLKENDLSETRNIVLIHLSEGNSDAGLFKRKAQQATGLPVYIAEPGLTLNLY